MFPSGKNPSESPDVKYVVNITEPVHQKAVIPPSQLLLQCLPATVGITVLNLNIEPFFGFLLWIFFPVTERITCLGKALLKCVLVHCRACSVLNSKDEFSCE